MHTIIWYYKREVSRKSYKQVVGLVCINVNYDFIYIMIIYMIMI